MADKFERIFEYRVLLTRKQELQIPLAREEELRLERLRQQFPEEVPTLDDRDPYTSMSEPLAADVVHSGRFETATVRNVSGGGLALAMNTPPALGQRVLVHVRDARYAFQYTMPGWVVSRVVKGHFGISVAFEGLPSRTPSTSRASGVYRAEDDTQRTESYRRDGSSK
jgi:hypothetical protein